MMFGFQKQPLEVLLAKAFGKMIVPANGGQTSLDWQPTLGKFRDGDLLVCQMYFFQGGAANWGPDDGSTGAPGNADLTVDCSFMGNSIATFSITPTWLKWRWEIPLASRPLAHLNGDGTISSNQYLYAYSFSESSSSANVTHSRTVVSASAQTDVGTSNANHPYKNFRPSFDLSITNAHATNILQVNYHLMWSLRRG